MVINTENLKESFKTSYDTYRSSIEEAELVWNLFHNRQYTEEQLNLLAERGQPAETFNVIKMFARQLVGFYSTKLNTSKVIPRHPMYQLGATVMNDVLEYIDEENSFLNESDKIKLDGFISGLFCSYINVIDTDSIDDYGRPIYKITKEYVPSSEILIDPSSTREDMADARFVHRFKWIPEDTAKALFKQYRTMDEYTDFLNIPQSARDYTYIDGYNGSFRYDKQYLVVHSIVTDEGGDTWSVMWSDDVILSKEKITYREVKNPYRVVKLQISNKKEYYGVFREGIEPQLAINQALIQIQLMSNTSKVLVQEDSVEDMAEFQKAYSRVNAIIPTLNNNGVRIDNLGGEIQQQYIIIDKALDRMQRVLGINDSFLGVAYASDSGRKVKLQQNATIMALRYIDNKLDLFYNLVGNDTLSLVKQFYKANQFVRVTDKVSGDRWLEINRPMIDPSTGTVIYDEELDPDTNEPMTDETGAILLTPLHTPDSDIISLDVRLKIESTSYNDEDEKNQIMLETALNGNIGQALMTVNPAAYFKMGGMVMKNMKTKESPEIARLLEETADMLQPQPHLQENLGGGQVGGQGANSQMAKLPTSAEQ